MGATDFTFRFEQSEIAIPLHVVFGSENVVRRLCQENSTIDRVEVIKCTGLKSLVLRDIEISIDSLFDIIACCPLVENLSLSNMWSKSQYDGNEGLPQYYDNIEQRRARAGSMITLLTLTSLYLSSVPLLAFQQLPNLVLDNLSSKFSNLKDLTLNFLIRDKNLYPADDVEIPVISSGSLEILNVRVYGLSADVLEIDVPRIRKFTFEGSVLPKFCFRSKSSGLLESHVSITNHKLSTTWFYKLSEFLTSMAGSKIRLCLHLHSIYSFDYLAGDIECLNVCELEDLIMDTRGFPSLSFYAFLDVLFRICHPKMITQYVPPPEEECSGYNHNDVILCRVLEQGMKGKALMVLPNQFMYGLRDLEELNAQKLYNDVWMPRPLESITSEQSRFRFQLKWKHP